MQFLDKYGWPVVKIKGRPVVNLIRLLLHTRKVKLGKFEPPKFEPSDSVQCGVNENVES